MDMLVLNQGVADGTAATFIILIVLSFIQGALIGFEREKAKVDSTHDEHYKGDFPGLRTFSLICMSGGLSGLFVKGVIEVPGYVSSLFFLSSLLFVIALATLFALYRFFQLGFIGMTTYIVMLLTFTVGFLTGYGYYLHGLSLTFLMSLILSLKRVAFRLSEKLSYDEYTAGLELGLVIFVIGPVIYALNPTIFGISLWNAYLFFAIVLTVSYLSYLSYKLMGRGSLKVVCVLGGLINSEATFTGISRFVSTTKEAVGFLLYILLGLSLRGLTVISLGSLSFLGIIGAPLFLKIVLPGFLLLVLILLFLIRRMGPVSAEESHLHIRSPIEFSFALRAAVIFIIIFTVVRIVALADLPVLLYPVSFVSGMASAIATVFSLLSSYPTIEAKTIAINTLIATSGALVNKVFYARVSYSGECAREVAKLSLTLSVIIMVYTALAAYLF